MKKEEVDAVQEKWWNCRLGGKGKSVMSDKVEKMND